jgi:hypothetical protein
MVSASFAMSPIESHRHTDNCLLLVASVYRNGSPSEINFLIFTSLWTLLALIYLTLTSWKLERFAHPWIITGVESLTMLFWFAGFIAAAVFLSDLITCAGHACSAAKAATVFAAFECKFWPPLTWKTQDLLVDKIMQGLCLPLQQPWLLWLYSEEVVPLRQDPIPWAPKSFASDDLVR